MQRSGTTLFGGQNPAEQVADAAGWSPAMPRRARIRAASHRQSASGAPSRCKPPRGGRAPANRAGEAPQTPHQQGRCPEGPNVLRAQSAQQINEACLSKPFVKLNLMWCQVHKENKQERKNKNSNIFPLSLELKYSKIPHGADML